MIDEENDPYHCPAGYSGIFEKRRAYPEICGFDRGSAFH